MFEFFKSKSEKLVICEADLELAISHIKKHPEAYPNKLPSGWSKKRFIDELKEELADKLPKGIRHGETIRLGFNMWGHIGSVGFDLSMYPRDYERLQLYISTREADTNPDKFIDLT